MRTIITVFKKELLDTIRDRRTIMFMVVIPLLLFPILFKAMFAIQNKSDDAARDRQLIVAVASNDNAARFLEIIGESDDINVITGIHADSVRALVRSDSLDGAFVFDETFDATVADFKPGKLTLYYKDTDNQRIVRDRMRDVSDAYEEELLSARFAILELDKDVTESIKLKTVNVASSKERFGKQIGGFLPYIFILFCFMGAMYPAIDLGAGEKERGTLETLLTAPVNRFHILLGKFGVVVVSGMLSAIVSMLGLYIGMRQSKELPQEFLDIVVKILGVDTILMVFSLLLPLTIFFAGLLLTISLSAKSFKEAQSLITPLNMAVIVPAAIGMAPGIEMSFVTAIIPVLNVSLATKEIIAGTITTPHLIAVYTSLVAFALLALLGCTLWFRRESTIFRT